MTKKPPAAKPRLPSTDPTADAFVHGGRAPEAAPEAPAAPAPAAVPAPVAAPAAGSSLTADLLTVAKEPPTIGAFYRLTPAHVDWLNEVARQRKVERGGRGRPDASEVIRMVLDAAMNEWRSKNTKAS